MSPIIAGRFDLERDARRAVEGLKRQGFAQDDVTAFPIEPPAAHMPRSLQPGRSFRAREETPHTIRNQRSRAEYGRDSEVADESEHSREQSCDADGRDIASERRAN